MIKSYLFHTGQNVGFSLVCLVDTYHEMDFVWICIGSEMVYQAFEGL